MAPFPPGGEATAHRPVQWETFEGENFCEFRGFVAIRESFLRKIWGRGILWHNKSEQSAKVFSDIFTKVFSLKSFLLYGSYRLCKRLDKMVVRYQRNGHFSYQMLKAIVHFYIPFSPLLICSAVKQPVQGHVSIVNRTVRPL